MAHESDIPGRDVAEEKRHGLYAAYTFGLDRATQLTADYLHSRPLRPLPDGNYLRTDVSATLFLSAPNEYEGGELSIDDVFGARRVKLPAGSLVAYPAGTVHEVMPVTRGERLACYLFMQSLVKDTEQRSHLFETDQALRSLRARYGEADPDLVRLTGLYNNLLRRWSEC